ncbi:hypothetical protein AM500_23720 [Bacillus sp. FJAT-18017]|uniref:two-component system sensor histidine kinase NtrB n=1 Tax=Bacillus sp. FJAT-18017 TaxID=1705566 RepID=UPI0006B0616A|nr:ATP-binding protein [Bacillus sp. FJAT-18017]ALC92436.1 hypothetical protein AM500_23720 [Bacillus sp. FJAT-18017]
MPLTANALGRIDKEEIKALKLSIWLFYIIFIGYDAFYFLIYIPMQKVELGASLNDGLGLWYHLIGLLLLPICFGLYKKSKLYTIKYFFFITYNLLDMINNLLIYYNTNESFRAGNFTEVVFIFFAPIFINKIYYWTVTIGIMVKYLITGLALQTTDVLLPLILLLLISVISYIILTRINSYINALIAINDEMNQKEKLINLGQMATGIAHEIRNPLTSLKGFIQLQQESPLSKSDYTPIMKQEVDRIGTIVDDLMILGKPKREINTQVNLVEIVDYAISICEQIAIGTNIKLIKEYEPLPINIKGDEKQLKQLVINLVKNAVESMVETGEVRIQISADSKDRVVLTVTDHGCGIPQEHLEKLFIPFFTTKADGTGLGLMVTNQIVLDHNGEIKIHSEVGKGTTINIFLPKE